MANETEYDIGVLRFGDEEIGCGSFKVKGSVKNEAKYITSQREGVDWDISEASYEWEASDVLPEYEKLIIDRFHEQTKDRHGLTISAYNFLENGDYEEAAVFYSCIIDDWEANQDKGKKLSVKGKALKMKH